MDITKLTLIETLEGLDAGKFTLDELWNAYSQRISEIDPKVESYLQVVEKPEKVGVPVGIKDIIVTDGIPTTAGSKILEGFVPPYNATVINKLLEKDCSVLGKLNLDEFAMGSSGENSAYKITKNPWDLNRVPGGSSSGSAAAVAADLCVFALGTDTGGSIRQPASFCGVVGLKPSYGRVSRYGSIAMASSLDQIGPITKTVADARLVLEWISGPDGYDSNTVKEGYRVQGTGLKDLKGVRVGVPKEYFGPPAGGGIDPEVEKAIKTAIDKLKELGAEIVEVTLPHTEYAIAVYYIIMASEVSSNLGRFTGIRYGKNRDQFGPEVKRRIMLGTYSLSSGYYDAYYEQAAKVRTLIKKDFDKAFASCDVIVGPVSPTAAWEIGTKVSDPLAMYLMDVYTVPPSLAGIPGLSVPCGFANGLPVGLHILGKHMDEETILNVGEVYEQNTEWHKERPHLDGARRMEKGEENV